MIQHDIHCHTTLSSCAKPEATAAAMLRAAKQCGLTVLGFANHLWDSDVPGSSGWYAPQNVEHVLSIRKELDAIPESEKEGVKIYIGCETEYVGQGRVALKAEHAELFDFVLVPPHHFHMRNFVRGAEIESTQAICKLMLERFEECCNIPFAFGLAHPFSPLGTPGREDEIMAAITDEQYSQMFRLAAAKNKSIEINWDSVNSDKYRRLSDGLSAAYVRMFTLAREAGCKFHSGSDSHHPERSTPERKAMCEKMLARCGITLAADPLKGSAQ